MTVGELKKILDVIPDDLRVVTTRRDGYFSPHILPIISSLGPEALRSDDEIIPHDPDERFLSIG